MDKKRKIILVGSIVLILVGAIALTYAFFSTGGKQELANTFTSGCLNITIDSETTAINLAGTYPVTDVEGLANTPYTFTIKNTCDKATNYQINLESIDQTANSLSANYVKVALSSDTMDNLISILGSNTAVGATITGSYEAYNLYTGTIEGNSTKTFNLREWIDYDVTKEEGASKTFSNKINVIANPDLIVTGAPELKTTLTNNNFTGTITGSALTASYCATTMNNCEPSISVTINNNTITIPPASIVIQKNVTTTLGNLTVNTTQPQIVCTILDSNKKVCSDPIEISGTPDFRFTSEQADNGTAGTCYYNSQAVNAYSGSISADTCSNVYEIKYEENDITNYKYYDSSFSNYFEYVGTGTMGPGCTYNDEGVLNWTNSTYADVTSSTCQTVYQANTIYGEYSYVDNTIVQDYVGEGVWDSANSACTYNSNTVYDWWGNAINIESGCGTVYYNANDDKYYSMFEEAGTGNYGNENLCSFNGSIVPDWWNGDAITNKADCGEVYERVSDGKYWASIKNVGAGTWQAVIGGTGIYEAEDDDGTSYYYRGAVENNYVKFAGYYWRIIRINGNGSIRMIYNGSVSDVDAAGKETVLANGYNDEDTNYTQIGTGAFNLKDKANDNTYVGFMYGAAGQTTYDATHTNSTNSTIKEMLDIWYNNNLANYADFLDTNAGFCNDRTPYIDEEGTVSGGGVGSTTTYYAARIRLITNKTPSLKCTNLSLDLYTTSNSSKGNKALTYAIGLITADEIAYAGAVNWKDNTSYYLSGKSYWTMSPSDFNGTFSRVMYTSTKGSFYINNQLYWTGPSVRPVINLKADTQFKAGSLGTIEFPYEVTD